METKNKINYPTDRLPTQDQSIEERELQLFIENDSDLYRQRVVPIQTNLVTKIARGTFDINKAPLIYKYLIDDGIRKYNKDNGGMSLSKEEKENLQNKFVNEFLDEAQYGNYENYLPKKYKIEKEDNSSIVLKDVKFISHTEQNPEVDFLQGNIDNDSFMSYFINVSGSRKGEEGMEYYKGENYVSGSKEKSYSKVYSEKDIPSKYKKAWNELKREYESKYKDQKNTSMTAKEKFKKVMAEWKDGKLESKGEKVTDFNQAIAIAFSEARTIDPNYGKKKSATKKDYSKMKNPISLEKTKEIVEFLKDNPDEETYLFRFKGIDYSILEKVKKKDSEGKEAETIHEEIEREYYGPSKIKESIKKKLEMSNPEEKKHSVVMFEAIDPATGKIRKEDQAKFIRLSKDYSKLGIIEFKEYGRKMPFGHLRPINDIKIFYYSPELERILDKYKLHYIVYDNKKELEEYLDTI